MKSALALALKTGALSIHAHSWQNHNHGTKSKLPPPGNFQKDLLLSSTEIHNTSVQGNTGKYASTISLVLFSFCGNIPKGANDLTTNHRRVFMHATITQLNV